MQSALARTRELNPYFYSKYPILLSAAADTQVIESISVQWTLPDEYLYFLKHYVPESVSWSTDEYINLYIYGAKDLMGGQSGYNYNPVKNEPIPEWPADYLVIASDEGDPYCIDLSRGDTAIYTAPHGAGIWNFSLAYDNLTDFLNSVLKPRSDEEEELEMGEQEQYSNSKVLITGPGRDKIKTLVFIKKVFECDFEEAKARLEAVPLIVYKGIDPSAAKIVDQLRSIGADYESQKISLDEFLGFS